MKAIQAVLLGLSINPILPSDAEGARRVNWQSFKKGVSYRKNLLKGSVVKRLGGEPSKKQMDAKSRHKRKKAIQDYLKDLKKGPRTRSKTEALQNWEHLEKRERELREKPQTPAITNELKAIETTRNHILGTWAFKNPERRKKFTL